jgi:hypothetical protein
VYFATWCDQVHKFLLKYSIPGIELIQFVENNENMINGSVQDFARDGFHPGVRSHRATANALYGFYKGVRSNKNTQSSKNLKLI